ncbi:DUF3164 family protein [Acidisoma sp. 7E03]
MTTPTGYLQDSQGRLVPLDAVKPQHLLEDELVREVIEHAEGLSRALHVFREETAERVKAYVEILAQQYGAARGGQKGNITLSSYNGLMRLQIAIGDSLTFGPELQIAKGLIDECLRDWTEGSRKEVRTLIEDVFQVGKAGKLNVDRILGLRKLDIADDRWKRAMDAISEAVRVQSSKEYVRLYKRSAPDKDFVQIPLDVARV